MFVAGLGNIFKMKERFDKLYNEIGYGEDIVKYVKELH